MAGKNQSILLLATIVISTISGICSATTYTVGGSTGWTIPTSASFYSDWAAKQTFKVGDVLVFNFPTGAHTVAEVSRANYNSCGTSNTIGAVKNTGPASITLNTAGTHYFICTVNGHCSGNQKLAVTVTGPSSTSPAASPTASPTTPTGGAVTPAAGPATASGGAASPSGSPTTPTAEGPGASAPPPAGNFAASTGVGLLSLVSFAVAALMA